MMVWDDEKPLVKVSMKNHKDVPTKKALKKGFYILISVLRINRQN